VHNQVNAFCHSKLTWLVFIIRWESWYIAGKWLTNLNFIIKLNFNVLVQIVSVYRKFDCMLSPHIQASYILKWALDVYSNVCSVTDATIWSLFSFHMVCRFYFFFHTLRFPFHINVTYCVTQLRYEDILTSCGVSPERYCMSWRQQSTERTLHLLLACGTWI